MPDGSNECGSETNTGRQNVVQKSKAIFRPQDWEWRDVGGPAESYSPLQMKYFSTSPAARTQIIEDLLLQPSPLTLPCPSLPVSLENGCANHEV
jgi:hypothetical protein